MLAIIISRSLWSGKGRLTCKQIVAVWSKKASSSRNKRAVGAQQRKLLVQPEYGEGPGKVWPK